MVWLSISISWLDFLPGGGLRSPGHWIFTQNGNFVKDVTGRNKKYQKYQLWAPDEFIIPPSSRALALHALIISLKPSAKIIKLQNERTEFAHTVKFRSNLFKLSFSFHLKILNHPAVIQPGEGAKQSLRIKRIKILKMISNGYSCNYLHLYKLILDHMTAEQSGEVFLIQYLESSLYLRRFKRSDIHVRSSSCQASIACCLTKLSCEFHMELWIISW